jgi:sulfite reductase (NADPH) hemoprotein beta-component
MPSVVTANLLRSGVVVYLARDGRWVESLGEAAVAADAAALKQLETLALAAVEQTEVTAVYAFDVRLVAGRPEPISVRERIRAAHAPTV